VSDRPLADLVKQVTAELSKAGIDNAPREARLLVAKVCNLPPDRVGLEGGRPVSETEADTVAAMVSERQRRKPLSHLLGYRAFYKHRFAVSPDVLDPRPETETLVLAALEHPFDTVLDLGTGSGAILLSLLADRPGTRGLGTDLSARALRVAEENARRLSLSDRARFQQGDWFHGIKGRFDLIVSNPPYIALDEMAGLQPELSYEPRMALTDEGDGLGAYRAITRGAPPHLEPGGRLLVEIGVTQGADVAMLFRAAGLQDVCVQPDLDGRDRVVDGRLPAAKQ